jgi:hypothetical protein
MNGTINDHRVTSAAAGCPVCGGHDLLISPEGDLFCGICIRAEQAGLEAELAYAEQDVARWREASELLRPYMENFPERTTGEALALMPPEDAARVRALSPAYIKVRR